MYKYINLFFALIIVTACSTKESAVLQYSREQCIVRLNIDWSTVQEEDKEYEIRQIMEAVIGAPDFGFNEIPASSSIQGDNREFIYFQHTRDCKNKYKNMNILLEYVNENYKVSPMLEVDLGAFKPGVDTIRVSGPWWTDADQF